MGVDLTRSLAERVLVVDDDAAFQKLVENVLGGLGLSCVVVRSGEEALKLCEDQRPRAVILDGLLPGLRGDEVAKRLRKRYPKSELPIVFTSAFYRDLKTRNHLLTTCSVDQVLHKPLRPEELKAALLRIPALAEASRAAAAQQKPGAGKGTPQARPSSAPSAPSGGAAEDEGVELVIDEAEDPELLAEFLALSQERAAGMQGVLSALGDQASALERLRTEAHRFRGSGGSYGLPELSRLGGLIEDLLLSKPDNTLGSQERALLVGLVEALADKVARAAGKRPLLAQERSTQEPTVLLLDGPGPLATFCAGAPRVHVAHEPNQAVALAAQVNPDVALVAGDREELDPHATVRRLVTAGVRSVVVMGGPDSLEARVVAQKAGARGHSFRLPDLDALRRFAREYHEPLVEARVVAVDGDPRRLATIAETLAPVGLAVEPCMDRRTLFEVLERARPALVVVGADNAEALELVRAVREDPCFRQVPLLLLTGAQVDTGLRLQAIGAGADELLPRNGPSDELAVRAVMLVRRRLREEREVYSDLNTGALREAAYLELLERTLSLARRAGRAAAVAIIGTDLHELRQTHGLHAAEALAASLVAQLRFAFRSTDAVARLGPDRFALLLQDVGAADARRLLDAKLPFIRAQDAARGVSVGLRTSVAAFPETPGDARGLLAAALSLLPKKA